MLEHLLFENSLPLAIGLGAVTVFLLLVARRRNDRRFAAGAVAVLLAGLIVVLAASLVTTTRERLVQLTRDLVARTQPLDLPGLRALFHPRAVLTGPDGEVWLQTGEILDELEAAMARYPIRKQEVREFSATILPGEQGRTMLDLRTTLDSPLGQSTVATRWAITWQREPDGAWRITGVQWLSFQNQPPARGLWRQ